MMCCVVLCCWQCFKCLPSSGHLRACSIAAMSGIHISRCYKLLCYRTDHNGISASVNAHNDYVTYDVLCCWQCFKVILTTLDPMWLIDIWFRLCIYILSVHVWVSIFSVTVIISRFCSRNLLFEPTQISKETLMILNNVGFCSWSGVMLKPSCRLLM